MLKNTLCEENGNAGANIHTYRLHYMYAKQTKIQTSHTKYLNDDKMYSLLFQEVNIPHPRGRQPET